MCFPCGPPRLPVLQLHESLSEVWLPGACLPPGRSTGHIQFLDVRRLGRQGGPFCYSPPSAAASVFAIKPPTHYSNSTMTSCLPTTKYKTTRKNLFDRIDQGVKQGVARALEEHRKAGDSVFIWRRGRIVRLRASQMK